ncbi:TPA: hypothetical protein ACGY73_000978 [Stenotrophomonas maltophilia]
MSGILQGFDKSLASQLIMLAAGLGYVTLMLAAMITVARRKREREFRLRSAVSSGLINGQITGVDDLVNIYRGITNAADDDVTYKAAVTKILRGLLVSLASNVRAGSVEDQLRLKIKNLLSEIQQQTPFADIPAAERNLILDARELIDKNELNAAKQKVGDLAGLIGARNDAYLKLQSANKWSVPLAIIGLILTILFGVGSFVS